jgi:hypothetical protein
VGAATEAGNSALEWPSTVQQTVDYGTVETTQKTARISTDETADSRGVLWTHIKKGASVASCLRRVLFTSHQPTAGVTLWSSTLVERK